jgi:hypothetical protein
VNDKNWWWDRFISLWPIILVAGTVLVGYGSWSTKSEELCNTMSRIVTRQEDFERRLIPTEVAIKEIPEMRAEIRRILEIVLSLKRRE